MDEQQSRRQIVEIGSRLYTRRYIAASDGNISVRLPTGDRFLTTPTGVCKGFLNPEDLTIVDGDGKKLQGSSEPSSELAMHMAIYKLRPDVNAVVHAHPPHGTGFAAAGIPLTTPLISEVVLTLGCIPLADYGTPTTTELAETITRYIPHYDALLLANHGALTYGSSLENAYFKMETLEHFAHISLVARVLGQERPLSTESVEKLFRIREEAGQTSPAAALCQIQTPRPATSLGQSTGKETFTLTRQELVGLISESVELLLRLLGGKTRR